MNDEKGKWKKTLVKNEKQLLKYEKNKKIEMKNINVKSEWRKYN